MLLLWLVLAISLAIGIRRLRIRGGRRFLWLSVSACLLLSLLMSCASDPLPNLPQQRSPLAKGTFLSIEHAMGTSQVPIQAQRVITVDTAALDAALALGVKPVGSVVYSQFPAYLGDQTEGIASVGEGTQPNLETILSLKPDLILGSKISSGKIYKHLDRIAPTVLTEGSGREGEWHENFRLFAKALNKESAGRQVLTDYQQRVKALQQQLVEVDQTVVSVVATGQGQIGLYTSNSFSGSVLEDIGFDRPSKQKNAKGYAVQIAREDLDSLNGDLLFLIHSPQISGSFDYDGFVSDPLWSKLSAVQNKKIYEVNSEVWTAGRNILAANQILDDIAQIFSISISPS
ncbi:ABC transporter substrate-binding protein [Acaryochloris marina]|uniref:Probable iron(III) dicitrate ABC transporter n=1 Tax=Acaryochloris marina (strain MBIC 11017) TaxID=329726 RepID=B0C004_ACAM1|nr:iron-siderophore ABC transporter substrate-binding protein [Acaryochloris marina]ABW28351.1 probable iron(III) dicitrate ABC transporter [Acaryochloris marina MBIC11017]BDM77370.1 iron siderophore-binding protein [Acaryochloris marina MBIC10699]